MALDLHCVTTLAGSDTWAFGDRIHMGKVTLSYAAGGAAGASVTAAIPPTMMVPGAAVFLGSVAAGVSASVNGNTITLTPTNSGNTLAAGSVAALVIG